MSIIYDSLNIINDLQCCNPLSTSRKANLFQSFYLKMTHVKGKSTKKVTSIKSDNTNSIPKKGTKIFEFKTQNKDYLHDNRKPVVEDYTLLKLAENEAAIVPPGRETL